MPSAETINAVKGLVGVGGSTILCLFALIVVLVVSLCWVFFSKEAVKHKILTFSLVLGFLMVVLVTVVVLMPSPKPQLPSGANQQENRTKNEPTTPYADHAVIEPKFDQKARTLPTHPKIAAPRPLPSMPVLPQQSTPEVAIPTTVPPACGPGVINCNLAPNQGHQDTYFSAEHQPPLADFGQTPLMPKSSNKSREPYAPDEGFYEDYPGVSINISVRDYFPHPMFRIVCGGPCVVTHAEASSRAGFMIKSQDIGFRQYTRPADPSAIYISFLVPNGALESGQSVICRLRSGSSKPLRVESVESYTK